MIAYFISHPEVEVQADGDTAVVAHGGVGTLLLCALLDTRIDRSHDQPGQGSYFCFDPETRRVIHSWRRLEAAAEVRP